MDLFGRIVSGCAESGLFLHSVEGRARVASVSRFSVRRATETDVPLLAPLFDLYRQFYGKPAPVLPEPQPLLTPTPKLPGTDGRKMSKSYGNTILLTDAEPVVRQKLKTMVTDPARVRRTDPGNPDLCPVGDLHKIFSSQETMAKVNEGCRSAGIGCIECKGWAADALLKVLLPIQERRKKYEENPRLAWDILMTGTAKAAKVAEATMKEVRSAMGMSLDYEPLSKSEGAK